MILDTYKIDSDILRFNRILNESNNQATIELAEKKLEDSLNEEFIECLPLKYTFYSLFPVQFDWMKERIKVYMMSRSLCIEFPESFSKNYHNLLMMFDEYVQDSWTDRVTRINDADIGVKYIIKLVAYG